MNIKKFMNRFNNIKLNENPVPIADDRNYTVVNNSILNAPLSNDKDLLIFDNNLSFEQSDFKPIIQKYLFCI